MLWAPRFKWTPSVDRRGLWFWNMWISISSILFGSLGCNKMLRIHTQLQDVCVCWQAAFLIKPNWYAWKRTDVCVWILLLLWAYGTSDRGDSPFFYPLDEGPSLGPGLGCEARVGPWQCLCHFSFIWLNRPLLYIMALSCLLPLTYIFRSLSLSFFLSLPLSLPLSLSLSLILLVSLGQMEEECFLSAGSMWSY